MIKSDFIDALNTIEKQDFSCYILTGKEAYQKYELIEHIHNKYKIRDFKILHTQIFNHNFNDLVSSTNNYNLFYKYILLQINIVSLVDVIGQKTLIHHISNATKNYKFLIVFEDFSFIQQKSEWFQLLTQNALHVKIGQMNFHKAIQFIKFKLNQNKNSIKLTEDALMLLINKTEGNLLAAKQVINVLQHHPKKIFDYKALSEYLINFMNYNVYDLIQSILEQNIVRSLTILHHLIKQKPENSSTILWAILKEIRIFYILKSQSPQERQQTYTSNNIWQRQQTIYLNLIKKFSKKDYAMFFKQCFRIDLIIKGIYPGNIEKELITLIYQLHSFDYFNDDLLNNH